MIDHRTLFYVLRYLGRLTKEPFTAQVGKHTISFQPPEIVKINPQFFKSAKCQRCGGCCNPGISKIATASDVEAIQQLVNQVLPGFDMFSKQSLTLKNPQREYEVDWWVTKKADRNAGCEFLFEIDGLTGCLIHEMKVVNCWIPLLHVSKNQNSNTAVVSKRLHGKLWVPSCTAKFQDFSYEELQQDLNVLQRLNQTAEDFQLATHLPDILNWFELHDQQLKDGWLPKDHVIIFNSTDKSTKGFF